MFSTEHESTPTRDLPSRLTNINRLLLIIALVSGACFRLYHLDRNPQGIHPDEALYAYEGWSLQTTGCDYRKTGCPPLFLKGYSTRWDNRTSVLYPYMYSALWRILPMTTENIRLPSVVFGMGVILLTYLVGLQLFAVRPLVAGISALLVSLSPIAIGWSRVGHDPITVPFLTLLMVYSVLRTRDHPVWWLIAGLALAVGMYSYQPFKFVGVTVGALSLWYIRPRLAIAQRRWFFAAAVLAVAVVLPFLVNQIVNWNTVQRQFNGINLLGSELGWLRVFWNFDQYTFALLTNVRISLVFVPLFCAIGLVLLWKQLRRHAVFLLLWLLCGVIPVCITYWRYSTNEMQSRGLGITGPLEIAAAFGLVWCVERCVASRRTFVRWISVGTITAIVIGALFMSGRTNQTRGGFCCFVLGGMDYVASFVQQPAFRDRPVVIQRFHFMQGVNMLWNMKIAPREAQAAPAAQWEHWEDNQLTPTEVLATIGRFKLCHVEDCYQPNDRALYVVPAELLPNVPSVATFNLWFFRDARRWKIVDNSLVTK